MSNRSDSLTRVAYEVLAGRPLNIIDLYGLAGLIEINQFKPEFLPSAKTISGKPIERKGEIFGLAEAYWGVKPQEWLNMENGWLKLARSKTGSQETKGKDQLDDVISAELLIRFIAAIHFIDGLDKANYEGTKLIRKAALGSINLTLSEVIFKGQTRMERYGGKSVYGHLKSAGVMIGTGGGKYLPYPEISLPILFQFLNKEAISLNIYR